MLWRAVKWKMWAIYNHSVIFGHLVYFPHILVYCF
jgi:hypothetical protein